MKYSMIATALFGAAIAVPAMPAAYGEGENVYGTQVAAQQTTSAPAAAETTCTDEAEQAVPYTTPVAQAQTTEAAMPESSAPSYGGAEGYGQQGSSASPDMMTSSVSEASPAGTTAVAEGSSMAAASSMPASSPAPAYSAPMNYGQGSETETKAMTETMVAQSTVPAVAATSQAAMGSSMASPEMSSPAQQYGSAPVPGATQSAAPYPMGNDVSPAGVAAASGTMGAAMPSGTGSVNGDTTPFEGAASSLNVAGLFAGIGAVAAFFI